MRRTVLVVDDSEPFRTVACALLVADGFDVVGEAPDGQSAIDMVSQQHPEIVLIDVALPDLDGFAVAGALARLPAPPQVVIMSSRDWADVEQRIASCGALGFLAKDCVDGAAITALVGDRP